MASVLKINSSARRSGSATRELTDRLVDRFGSVDVVDRDLADGVPHLDESTLAAMWTPPDQRTDDQQRRLAVADGFIDELTNADLVVIGLPIYNFGPPASVKAWADLVARAGTTFRYTDDGPEGLLEDRPAYIVAASGGVPIGSPVDHSSTWLATFLAFLGISSTTTVPADRLNVDPDNALATARRRIDDLELHDPRRLP